MIALVSILISVLAFHFSSSNKWKAIILIIASIFVYAAFVKWYVLLIPIISLLTYLTMVLSHRHKNEHSYLLLAYCVILLSGLFVFKHSAFGWILPVGYSVISFSGISIIVDAHKYNRPYSIFDVLCFLSFYPKILSGPLERIEPFTNMVVTSKWEKTTAYIGIKYIVFGLFGKYVVADGLGQLLSFTTYGINAVLEAIIYAIQFYLDFWSYCNIAYGISLLYGIQLTRNFSNPYSSASFKQFWRSWNISLGTWLRDYVYIPLGGNRTSKYRNVINVLIVFIVSGLWHGSTFGFVLWGVLHGSLYCIEKTLLCNRVKQNPGYHFFVIFITMLMWQLFRLPSYSDVISYLEYFTIWQPLIPILLGATVFAVIVLLIFESQWFHTIIMGYSSSNKAILLEVLMVTLMAMSILLVNYNNSSPFFYFSY